MGQMGRGECSGRSPRRPVSASSRMTTMTTTTTTTTVIQSVLLGAEQSVAGVAVVVVAVAGGDREAVLAVGARGAGPGRVLVGRGWRGLAEGRVEVAADLRVVVYVRVVDQRDVVDEVVDEELRVGHEVVDGVSGFGFLAAFVQRATEGLHHSHSRSARCWGWL